MEFNYKIYGLKLKDNEEIKYIGYTKKVIEERLKEHLTKTIKDKYKNAYWLRKYKDSIEIILLKDDILTQEEAFLDEISYIKLYKELGYNLNNTTEGRQGFKGKHTEETKEKLRNFNLGKKHTEETKNKIRNIWLGKKHTEETKKKMSENNTNKGKSLSIETKEKISKSLKGNIPPNRQKIEAYVYKTGEYIGIFESHADCAKQLNISGGHINQVVSGKRKQTGGYTFKKINQL